MTSSSRAPAIGTPAAAWFLAVVVAVLCLQLIFMPQIGVPLTALALIIAVVVVLVLASSELDRDVVHMAMLGTVLGGACEAWLRGGNWFWHGAFFGMLVGGLIGDEIQLSHKWLKLTRQAKAGTRWWQRLPRESKWLPRAVWIGFAVVIGGTVLLALRSGEAFAAQQGMVDEWFEVFRTRRIESSTAANILYAWFALVVLCISVALSRFVARVPNQTLLVESLFRRIAVLQCAALLMLALDGTARSIDLLTEFPLYDADFHPANAMVDTLRLVLLPLYVLMIAQIFLGKRLFHYWRRSGWIVALGMASLTGVLVLQVCVTFALSMRVG